MRKKNERYEERKNSNQEKKEIRKGEKRKKKTHCKREGWKITKREKGKHSYLGELESPFMFSTK